MVLLAAVTLAAAAGLIFTDPPTSPQPPAASGDSDPETADLPDPTDPPIPEPTTPPETAPDPSAEPTAAHTPVPSGVGPADFPGDINPLTGEQANPDLLNRMPLAIKISNFPAAGRPHSGLSFADMVFEYFIGEGMTRFLAFFYGQDAEKAGPIRSGRLIDGELVRLYGGVLGMKGADGGTTDALFNKLPGRVFNASPAACPALCPYTTSHTYGTFSDTAAFSEYIETRGLENTRPELDGMRFDPAPPDGLPADFLHIYYSWNDQIGWEYDPVLGAYLRSQDPADGTGELYPMPDALTGEQLAFENVVILFAYHTFRSPTSIEIQMWYARDRRAVFLRDGLMVEGTFTAVDEDRPLQFETLDGDLYSFKPGSTWFQVVGLGSTLDPSEEPGSWYLRFYP